MTTVDVKFCCLNKFKHIPKVSFFYEIKTSMFFTSLSLQKLSHCTAHFLFKFSWNSINSNFIKSSLTDFVIFLLKNCLNVQSSFLL